MNEQIIRDNAFNAARLPRGAEGTIEKMMLTQARLDAERSQREAWTWTVPCDVSRPTKATPTVAAAKRRAETIAHVCLVRLAKSDVIGASEFAASLGETTARVAVVMKNLADKRLIVRNTGYKKTRYEITKLGRQKLAQDKPRVCEHSECDKVLGNRNTTGWCTAHRPRSAATQPGLMAYNEARKAKRAFVKEPRA